MMIGIVKQKEEQSKTLKTMMQRSVSFVCVSIVKSQGKSVTFSEENSIFSLLIRKLKAAKTVSPLELSLLIPLGNVVKFAISFTFPSRLSFFYGSFCY
jgi:hypothetical protein